MRQEMSEYAANWEAQMACQSVSGYLTVFAEAHRNKQEVGGKNITQLQSNCRTCHGSIILLATGSYFSQDKFCSSKFGAYRLVYCS